MDYYIAEGNQKQGPYDIITIIKKVKAGIITSETLVATSQDGEFQPATSVEEINTLLQEHGQHAQTAGGIAIGNKSNIKFPKALREGMHLWMRYVISFIIISGVILSVAFGLSVALKKITIAAEYPAITNYVVSLITASLYMIFFYYILLAKRSQTLGIFAFFGIIKKGIPAVLFLSAIFSVYTLAYGLSEFIGLITIVVLIFICTLCAFVPFQIFDTPKGVGGAVKASMSKALRSGSDTFGVILALVAINLIVALFPAFISPELLFFGLFISIPITVSSLAYIHDELFS